MVFRSNTLNKMDHTMKKGIKIVQGNDEHLVIDGDNFMLWSLLHLLDRCGVCITYIISRDFLTLCCRILIRICSEGMLASSSSSLHCEGA